MKIIFLDFDGVILTNRTRLAHGQGWSSARPDAVVCKLLDRVCSVGPRIVVSSAWRDAEEGCKAKLGQGGLLGFLHADWRTGEMGSRPKEIAAWLAAHPEVTDYVIIDDESFEWTPEQHPRWLACHPLEGLQSPEMEQLLAWAGLMKFNR